MRQCLVAVMDGSKARFFILSSLELAPDEAGPKLIEQESLYNSAQEMQGQELWANVKTGRNRGAAGQAHSYDDHRQNHRVEFERRFAQAIINRITDLAEQHEMRHLILVAEPQILGILRDFAASLSQQLTVHEVAKDLCRLSAQELHGYLAERSLLPSFRRAGF